jgi:hypothetical protein
MVGITINYGYIKEPEFHMMHTFITNSVLTMALTVKILHTYLH